RPEFLNRIDETIMFEPLTRTDVHAIAEIQLKEIGQRLALQGFELSFSEAAVDWLAQLGYDPQFGARPLKRVLQKRVMDELSKAILSGQVNAGQPIHMDYENGTLSFRA
ncbi:MAG: type VI secretion system ATPase TssH, partial [Bacteroidia bacterium]